MMANTTNRKALGVVNCIIRMRTTSSLNVNISSKGKYKQGQSQNTSSRFYLSSKLLKDKKLCTKNGLTNNPLVLNSLYSKSLQANIHTTPQLCCIWMENQKEIYVEFPGKDLTMINRVVDTHPDDIDQDRLTVLYVLGNRKDSLIKLLFENLHKTGARVIAANYIGTDKIIINPTKVPRLYYDFQGRLHRQENILKTLKVERIDMVITNSKGVWTLLNAGAHWDNISCLVVLNPSPSNPYRFTDPFRPAKEILEKMAYFFITRYVRKILETYVRIRKPSSGYLFKLYWMIMAYTPSDVQVRAEAIRKKKTPMLIFLSEETDPKTRVFSEMFVHKLLQIPKESVVNMEQKGFIFKTITGDKDPFFVPSSDWFARCIVFKHGSDSETEKLHGKEVMAQIEDFLRRTRDVDWSPRDDSEEKDVSEEVENSEGIETSDDGKVPKETIKDYSEEKDVSEEVENSEGIETSDDGKVPKETIEGDPMKTSEKEKKS